MTSVTHPKHVLSDRDWNDRLLPLLRAVDAFRGFDYHYFVYNYGQLTVDQALSMEFVYGPDEKLYLTDAGRVALSSAKVTFKKTIWFMWKPGEERTYAMSVQPDARWAAIQRRDGFHIISFEVEIPDIAAEANLGTVKPPLTGIVRAMEGPDANDCVHIADQVVSSVQDYPPPPGTIST